MSSEEFKKESDLVKKGLKLTFQKLIKYKIENGFPLVVAIDGKVVKISPSELRKKYN